jgi:para-nitrobenzyl esterase
MNRLVAAIISVAILTATSFAQSAATADPVVRLDAGVVSGLSGWKTAAYLGIPFAAPPVGVKRWIAPAAVRPWTGVRDATHLAAACATVGFGDGPRNTNEDCLYLNVYAPLNAKRGDTLPVMVFFHGGGNLSGSPLIYDGARMAEVTHAVVVIPAYRLGVFSSLVLPSAGDNGGTLILQDNLAALHWVQRNAAAFGGNPRDVTISGESSGGTNVCNLLAAPSAARLFRQAIIQSGSCSGNGFGSVSLATMQAASKAFATSVGCTSNDPEPCLRAKPAGELMDAWKARSGTAYGTTLLPLDPVIAFKTGRINKVPLLIGFNRDEWWPFEHGLVPLTPDGLQKQFASTFGDRAAAVAALYPEANFPHREYALGAAVGDALIICPSLEIANALAARVPVSVYEFADRTVPPFKSLNPANAQPRPPGYSGGAGHTSELQYLYAYQAAEGPLNATQRRLGDEMIQHWVAFNRATPPVWPPYTAARPVVTQIGADGIHFVPKTNVAEEHHCGYWKTAGPPPSVGL